MLEVIYKNEHLDIKPDLNFCVEIVNPFFVMDYVPVFFTHTFEVCDSPRNLRMLNYPNRITSTVDFSSEDKGELRFAGIVIASGMFIKGDVTSTGIELEFRGAILPKSIRKYLQNQNLGMLHIGEFTETSSSRPGATPTLSTNFVRKDFVNLLEAQAVMTIPDFVAAPLSISGIEPIPEDKSVVDKFQNLKYMRVNSYRQSEKLEDHWGGDGITKLQWSDYDGYFLKTTRSETIISKIIPSFRVGYILEQLTNKPILGNIFNGDFEKLMLICNHSSYYQTKDNSTVWRVDGKVANLSFADYMPDIPANEFISEVLKLTSAVLYIQNDRFIIEYRDDILKRPAPKGNDWTSILEGGYTISTQPGENYIFSLAKDSNTEVSPEKEKIIVDSIQDMISSLELQNTKNDSDNSFYYEVKQTEQIFEAMPDPLRCDGDYVHWKLKLISQSPIPKPPVKDELEQRSDFDVSFKGMVCRTSVVDFFCADHEIRPVFKNGKSDHIKCIMPEVEINTNKPQRSAEMVFGLWHGMQFSPKNYFNHRFIAPLISHSNYLPDGTKDGELSLTNECLTHKYHLRHRQWIEKDKKVVKGRVRLTPRDINQLDLRNKIHLQGRDFLIHRLSIPITINAILPSEVEFIEA